MEGLQRAENPTEEYPKVSSETLMREGVALRGLRPLWRLRRPRHIGSSCDALELRARSHARLLARSGAAAFGRSGHWQRGLRRPLAPSAPAGTCIGMRLSRAGQSNLARLLARKPWTPRAFRAKGIKSTGTPHFAPSAKFQLILQVLPTKLRFDLGEQMPKEARRGPSPAMVNINRIQSFNPSLFLKKGGFQDLNGTFNGTRSIE